MATRLSRLSEDFGERFARDLYHCSSCNYCVDAIWPERGIEHVCVTMEHHTHAPGYAGRGYIEAARALFEGVEIDAGALAERVFTCTTCGNCETACPIGLRPAGVALALREELVGAGIVPPVLDAVRASIAAHGTPYGAAGRAGFVPETSASGRPGGGPAYFPGCAAYVAYPDEARAAFSVMRKAGCEPVLAEGSGRCCGAALAELGDVKGAMSLRAALSRADLERGIVTSGYACRRHLAEVGAAHTAITFADWLAGVVDGGRASLRLAPGASRSLRVACVESCQLKPRPGRPAPTDESWLRSLLVALGLEVASPRYPSVHALCCGAAGGMPSVQPAAAKQMAAERIARTDVAADVVVTLDPRCAAHLREAADARTPAVLGIAEFVDRYCTVTPLGEEVHR